MCQTPATVRHLHVYVMNKQEGEMPRGDKSKYTDKEKRQAQHIEEGYESRGVSEDEAERRAWATVNKVHGGGEKPGGGGYGQPENHEPMRRGGLTVIAVLAFIALNVIVARVVHFYWGVAFDFDALIESAVFQTGISILWGLTAGLLMTMARMRINRPVWMVGAGVLAALIVKLFLIDLGNVGGIARIVSFLATGVLILAIGYFAPLPPKAERTA